MGGMKVLFYLCFFFIVSAPHAASSARRDVVVAAGHQLEILTGAPEHEVIDLSSHNVTFLAALAHDPVSQKLIFSDLSHQHADIFSIDLKHKDLGRDVSIIIKKADEMMVESIAHDPVDEAIFWTDAGIGSIHRSQIGGKQLDNQQASVVEVVHPLADDLPRGIVADPCARMLYWTNWHDDHPTIERSFMNGSERQVLIREELHKPSGITLDLTERKIYWADNLRYGAFRIERSNLDGSRREIVYSGVNQFLFGLTVDEHNLYWTDWEDRRLYSLAKGVRNAQPEIVAHFSSRPMSVVVLQPEPFNCSSRKEADDISMAPVYGNVIDLCSGYCLNEGQCIQIDSEVQCSCTRYFSGDRCQDRITVTDSPAAPSASPADAGCILSSLMASSGDKLLFNAVIIVSILCLALAILVIFLSVRVFRLSKRPRLKRRFFGTPRKASQQAEPVIDIENCCNMNICETPCVEPPSRTPGKQKGSKSGDKEKLLDF